MALAPPSSLGGGLTLLFTSTLGADTAAIDTGAGGISSGLNHLLVYALLRTDQAAATGTVLVRANGNSGGNYDTETLRALNVTASAAAVSGATSWVIDSASANSLAAVFSVVRIEIPFYTATTALKSALIAVGTGGDTAAEMFTEQVGATFRSAGAVTQLSVTAGTGLLVTGSALSVYGF